jgi:hypothetical protein
MRRGFKSEAERLAERTRAQMGLRPHDRLDIRDLTRHLNVDVIPADQLVDRGRLKELERLQPGAFAAATFHLPDGRTVAVCNPCSDPRREWSSIPTAAAQGYLLTLSELDLGYRVLVSPQ